MPFGWTLFTENVASTQKGSGAVTNSQILHPHVFRDQMDSHRNFLRIYNRQADSKQRKTGTVEVMRTLLSTEHAQRAMDICSIPI